MERYFFLFYVGFSINGAFINFLNLYIRRQVVTGDLEGAAEAIQEVGIVQDVVSLGKSAVSLAKV